MMRSPSRSGTGARAAGLIRGLGVFLAVSLAPVPVSGQAPAPAPAPAPPVASEAEQHPASGQINEILQGEEEAMAGEGYSYDPGNRRDPFKSLLAGSERPELAGPRPEGVPGLLIDEIDLTGIFIMPEGPVAQVQASNKKKSYLLRVGDQLYDGDVVSITPTEVVFKQIVNDPTALKPFREVVKKLNP